jgi:hypothetical protein
MNRYRFNHTFFEKHSCGICLDSFTVKDIFVSDCSCVYCNNCVSGYIKHQIDNGSHKIFRCAACRSTASDYIIEKYTDENYITKYMDLVNKHESFKFCVNGHEHCRQLITKTTYYSKCITSKIMCIACNEEFDIKHSCKQRYILEKLKDENTEPCPRCFILITKEGGCNHVNCLNCGHDFNFGKHINLVPSKIIHQDSDSIYFEFDKGTTNMAYSVFNSRGIPRGISSNISSIIVSSNGPITENHNNHNNHSQTKFNIITHTNANIRPFLTGQLDTESLYPKKLMKSSEQFFKPYFMQRIPFENVEVPTVSNRTSQQNWDLLTGSKSGYLAKKKYNR